MRYRFVQARNYTRTTGGRAIDLIVVHTAETPEDAQRAESLAGWAAGSTAPRASWHYAVDPDSVVQSVRDQDAAWAAPGANHDGIHVELAGRAGQTAAQWQDAESRAILRRAAGLFAELAEQHNIPLVWLDPDDLIAGRRGITSHVNISRAFRRSDHWDPGPAFPRAQFMGLVRVGSKPDAGERPDVKGIPPTLRRGDSGWQVKRLQTRLRLHGSGVVRDGGFGPATEAAVMEFERVWGLKADGIAGSEVWKGLRVGPAYTQRRRRRAA